MTTGALLFAQNNSLVNYIKMAEIAATRIEKYLGIPVSLVTDDPSKATSSIFNSIIEIPPADQCWQKTINDGSTSYQKVDWKNFSRSSAYNLTPYSTTLVIDTDYIINSKVLLPALSLDHDLQIYKNSMPLASWRNKVEFQRISPYSIPFYWATTFIFKKNLVMKSFFDLVEYIKLNWHYYKNLYNISSPVFRNDYAFSIAIHLMSDYGQGEFAVELPGTMTYITDKDMLINATDDSMQFLIQKEKNQTEFIATKTQGIDVHVMNKLSLLRVLGDSDV